MERRDWSLEVLNKLIYIDSLDEEQRAQSLSAWVNRYLDDDFLNKIDLDDTNFQQLLELFYKNINFLRSYTNQINLELNNHNNIKKFLQ